MQMVKNGVAGLQSNVVRYINQKRKGMAHNTHVEEVPPEVLMEPQLAETSILRVIILVA